MAWICCTYKIDVSEIIYDALYNSLPFLIHHLYVQSFMQHALMYDTDPHNVQKAFGSIDGDHVSFVNRVGYKWNSVVMFCLKLMKCVVSYM